MLKLDNVNGCLNVKLHTHTKNYDKNMIMDFYNNTFLNDKNGLVNECVNTATQNANNNDIDFDGLYAKNPLWLLNECFACECGLTRNKNPLFRNFVEHKINNDILPKYSNKKTITYSTYHPSYFFQDVVILTEMKNKILDNCVITVNMVGNTQQFVKLIGDKTYVSCDDNFGNDDKGKWIKMHIMRIIQMLQWFDAIDMKINLNIYDDCDNYIKLCKNDSVSFSDITVGIDYVDDGLYPKYLFKIFALCVTVYGGDIISLRTDGIPFFRKLEYCFEIYKNGNPLYCIDMWEQHNNEINNLQIDLDTHIITENDDEPKNQIIKDGNIYKFTGYRFNENGRLFMYVDDLYDKTQSDVEDKINVMYKHFDDISNDLNYSYNFNGGYYKFVGAIYGNYVLDYVLYPFGY